MLTPLRPAAEFGDYDPAEHTPGFVSEFRFCPVQTETIEEATVEHYKKLRWAPAPAFGELTKGGPESIGALRLWRLKSITLFNAI